MPVAEPKIVPRFKERYRTEIRPQLVSRFGSLPRRLVPVVIVLFGITLVTFFLLRLIPGDPALAILGSSYTHARAQAIDSGLFGIVQPDAAKWGGHSGCLPVARAALAAGRSYCPHYLGGAIGLVHSLHLLAAVRGPGLLEVDANPNPLREGVLQDLVVVMDGCVALPGGQGLGLEPDLKPLSNLRSLRLERRA